MAKNSSDFLDQIFKFQDQIKDAMKDVIKAVDDMKKSLGTDLFDTTAANDMVNSAEKLLNIMTDQLQQMKKISALNKQIIGDFENNSDFLNEIFEFQNQIKNAMQDVIKVTDDMRKSLGTDLFDATATNEMINNAEKLLNIITDQLQQMNKISTLNKQIIGDFENNSNFLDQILEFQDQIKSVIKDVIKVIDDMKKSLGTDLFDATAANEMINNAEQLLDTMTNQLQQIKNIKTINKQIIGDFESFITLKRAMIDEEKAEIKVLQEIQGIISQLTSKFTDMFDSFADSVKNIPVIGDFIYQAMGVDRIKEKLTSDLKNTFQDISKTGQVSFSTIANAGLSTFKAMASGISNILKVVLLNPWLLLVVGISLVVKKFVDLQNQAEDFRKTTGLSYDSAKQLTHEIENSALNARMFGVEIQDAFASASALVKEFGNSKVVTGQLATNLAVLSKTTGISEENAAKVYRQFSAMNGATSQSAANMGTTLAYASQLVGVPMDTMFEDIAENSEFISTYMGSTGKALMSAAIQARLLGLSLKDTEAMMSSIMNFEDSIEKELNASILIGRQLDFNRARQLAFNGDIANATKEVMRQVGSLDEFNKLNPVAKKAFADAVGLSVDALRNSLQTQELLNNVYGDEKKKLQEALDIIEGKVTASIEEQKLAIMNQSALTNMKNLWGQIGASLTKIILPAIELIANVLQKVSTFIIGIFDGIDSIVGKTDEGTSKWWVTMAKGIAIIGGIIVSLLTVKVILTAITAMTNKIFSGGGGVGGIGGDTGLMGKLFGNMKPGQMLSGAASILIISGAIWVFAKALQELQKNDRLWETLGAAIIGLVALTAVASTLGSATPAILLGSFSITVLAGALWILGKAINEFVPYVKVLFDGIANIADIIGKTVVNIINAVADSIVKIGNIDAVNLMGVAAGIGAIALAFGAFGAGSVSAGFGSFIGNLLGGDPIAKLERLAVLGPGLMATAMGIQAITAAQNGEPIPVVTSVSAVPESINIPATASTTLNDTILNGDNLIIEKLNELITAVNNQNIYLDNRKVNTNLGRNNINSKLS